MYCCDRLLLGLFPIGVHSALHSYTPQHIALLRFLIASFFTAFGHEKGIQPLNWKDVPALAVLGFFSVTLHHLLINTGQQYVTAVASSILSQSIPLFTFIISALLLRNKSISNNGYVFYWDFAALCWWSVEIMVLVYRVLIVY